MASKAEAQAQVSLTDFTLYFLKLGPLPEQLWCWEDIQSRIIGLLELR